METEETTTTMEAPKTGTPGRAPGAKRVAKSATKKASKATAAKKPIAKKAARPAAGKGEVRDGTKKAIVLELLRRKQGATTAEIAKATDWQNHSIRGFISGNVTKKMGLAVQPSKNEAGERTYKIVE
jgi:hypothetical protein